MTPIVNMKSEVTEVGSKHKICFSCHSALC